MSVQYWFYLAAVAALLGWAAVVGLRSQERVHRRLAGVAVLLFGITLVWFGAQPLAALSESPVLIGIAGDMIRLVGVAWWLVLALLVIVLLDRVVWPHFAARGMNVPRLLPQIIRAVVVATAFFGIVSSLFEQSLTGLLATSGVIAIVLGFATQTTLADIFSGIAINIERPYRVGDWIQIDNTIVGQVTETNWRATRLRSAEGNAIIMPNSKLAAAQIVNYDYPSSRYQSSVKIVLDIRIPPERAAAALRAGALDSPRVLPDPPPRAIMREYRDNAVLWEVQYWVDGFDDAPQVRDEVARGVWVALDVSELGPGVFPDKPPKPPAAGVGEARRLLGHVDLFRNLDLPTQSELAAAMRRHIFQAGETVVRRGDAAESLYIVAEGMLDVRIELPHRGRTVAARIGGGEVFGEMSLLTGAPRSADVVALVDTVAYEVSKPALAAILRRLPNLAEELGEIVAARRMANLAIARTIEPDERRVAAKAEGDAILARMRDFFGLD